MHKSIATAAFISAFFLFFFSLRLFLAKTFGLDISPFQAHNLPEQSVAIKTNRVVILTGASYEKVKDFDGIDGFYQKMWDNRLSYTEAHGYTFMLLDSNKFSVSVEKHPAWCKLPAIAEALEENPSAEWIWWLDLDTIIMTPHLDLHEYLLDPAAMKSRLLSGERIIPNDRIPVDGKPLPDLVTGESMNASEIDLILTQDWNGLNAGSFFIRNTPLMRLFVDLWNDPIFIDYAHNNWLLRDQDLFLHLIFQHPTLRKRIGWVQQNTFNAYAEGADTVAWRPGDLVIHFPSCGNDGTCKELFERFWPQREVLPGRSEHYGVPPHLLGEPSEEAIDEEDV